MPAQITPQQLNLKLRTSLKMAISKLKFIQNKKTALAKQQRRQLADLLSQGKEASATIRVEMIIREDVLIELLEYLELYTELLLARISLLLDPSKSLDPSLKEAVLSIIYAEAYAELSEITTLKDLFIYKYGNEFAKAVLENTEGDVPEKVTSRCVVEPPPGTLVNLYLREIARTYDVPYSEYEKEKAELQDKKDENNDENEGNNDDEGGGGIGVKENEPLTVPEGELQQPSNVKKSLSDFDALKARFDALKGGR